MTNRNAYAVYPTYAFHSEEYGISSFRKSICSTFISREFRKFVVTKHSMTANAF